jgi:hypothetical protein
MVPPTGAPNGLRIQLPRAHGTTFQKTTDLTREAVSCNGGLGRTSLVMYIVY